MLNVDLVCAAWREPFYAYTVFGVSTMASACVTPLAQRAIEDPGISATVNDKIQHIRNPVPGR